jgi:hypothetical protein
MLLYGEEAEVDKGDPQLLAALDLYAIVTEYNPENVYLMDETGLIFGFYRDIAFLCRTKISQLQEAKRKSKIEFL